MIIFLYLSLLTLKPSSPSSSSEISLPIPAPRAVIRVPISTEDNTLDKRAFSQLMIFPLKGRIACVALSLPCFAEPPAESPSTIKISHFSGSFS